MDALRNPRAADQFSKNVAFGLILSLFTGAGESSWKELVHGLLCDDEPVGDDKAPVAPAIAFYFWTHLPCWFIYGRSPTSLIRNVSEGGELAEQSAQRLVRLDHRAHLHPSVRRWASADRELAPFRQLKLQKWLAQTPFDKEKSSSATLRVIAGFVSRISELLGDRVESPELRSLIEALGSEIPPDLQAYLVDRTDDDWSREIRRHRKHFELPPQPDKSVIESVRALVGDLP
jgi:hypothetical protein